MTMNNSLTSVDDAIRLIRERTPETAPVRLPLEQAFGRILRETLVAPHDLPRTDRATMDGYAVRADDAALFWRIVRAAPTHDAGVADIAPGEAVKVATGTALTCVHPVRVIPQELTVRDGDTLRCDALPPNLHVHRRGSDAKSGDTLLKPGIPTHAGVAALIASLGHATATVTRPLRIRHYTTGDEIVAPGGPLPPGSVYDSNGPLIAGLLHALGETVTRRHLREDYLDALATVSADLATEACDLLLVSGGAGPGAGDFTEKLLRDLGYDIALRGGVNVRPGKPLIFGAKPDGVAFGLPGNPLSHRASFHTFVMPAIERLRGEPSRVASVRAIVDTEVTGIADARPTYHPARLRWGNGEARVSLHSWSASGNVRVMAEMNAFVFVPTGLAALRAGDTITATFHPSAL